jgi:molybdopterin converting factor subunit 1
MENVNIKVLFFAKSRELVGFSEATLLIPSKIFYADLLNTICAKYNLNVIKDNIILALNEEYCENCELQIKQGDEIAVIPPLSGG